MDNTSHKPQEQKQHIQSRSIDYSVVVWHMTDLTNTNSGTKDGGHLRVMHDNVGNDHVVACINTHKLPVFGKNYKTHL